MSVIGEESKDDPDQNTDCTSVYSDASGHHAAPCSACRG